MRNAISITAASCLALLVVTLALACRFPVPELQAEIGQYEGWFPSASTRVSYARGYYVVEVDMSVTEDNFDDTIMALGILIGCAARVMPEGAGTLRMATERLYFDVPLDDCRTMYAMALSEEDSIDEILAYMQVTVAISER